MKKSITGIFSVYLLLLAGTAFSQKQREKYEHVKERTITRTYTSGSNKLSIDNKFGDVKVTTWNKNEIKVDIKIETTSNDADWAQQTFDAIDVKDKQDGGTIAFVTEIKSKDTKEKNCKNCKTSMSIDYTISMPANSPLKIDNSFGMVEIPDYTGAVDVNSKFGGLKAGHLSNPKDIKVEFGAVDIKKTSSLDADFKFSSVSIGSLGGNNDINLSFCGDSKISLDADLSSLKIKESYSSLNLRPHSNLAASYAIKTSFGDFKDRAGIGIERTDKPQKYGPDSNRTYSGQKGSGSAKIDVSSSFGTIIVGEPTAEDKEKMKSKEKTKNKNKGTVNI